MSYLIMNITYIAIYLHCFILVSVCASSNIVILTNSGPAVRGSNVTFTATILRGYTGEELQFIFTDDAAPEHYHTVSHCIGHISIKYMYR